MEKVVTRKVLFFYVPKKILPGVCLYFCLFNFYLVSLYGEGVSYCEMGNMEEKVYGCDMDRNDIRKVY